ncbi:MAG TPA: hypothetical protein VHF26_14980 [Trebonia sp.]|nr:hypothetical protein [Trebonia sp.]
MERLEPGPVTADEHAELERLRAEAGCVLAPVSVIGVWGANQVANMAQLIHDPAIRHALSDQLTAQVTSRVDVKALVTQASGQLAADRLPRLQAQSGYRLVTTLKWRLPLLTLALLVVLRAIELPGGGARRAAPPRDPAQPGGA